MGICNSTALASGNSNAANQNIGAKWRVENGQEQPHGKSQQHDQDQGVSAKDVEPSVDALPLDLALNTIAAVPLLNGNTHGNVVQFWTGWEDGTIKRLDVPSKAHQQPKDQQRPSHLRSFTRNLQVHTRGVNRMIASTVYPDTLFTCSRDTTICRLSNLNQSGPDAGSDESDGQSGARAGASSNEPTQVNPSLTLRGHSLNVSTIAVDDHETTLCSGGRDTQTILWDLATGQVKSKNSLSQNVVTCSKWLPNGERLIAQGSEDLHVRIWDERAGLRTPSQIFDGYVYFPLCLDVSSDGKYLLTSSKGFNGVGAEIRIWDRRMNRQLRMFEGHQQDASCCLFLPFSCTGFSGTGIPIPVSASKDGTMKIWNVSNPAKSSFTPLLCEIHEPTSDLFTSLCAFPTNKTQAEDAESDTPSSQMIDFEFLAGTFHGQLQHIHCQYQIQTNSVFIL